MDLNGRRRNKSTKVPLSASTPTETRRNQKTAQEIADCYEAAGRNRRTVLQARKIIMELTEEISGVKVIEKSLRTVIADWLERKSPTVSSNTLDSYRTVTGSFLSYMFEQGLADGDIAAVSRDDVTRYRNEIAKTKAPKTVNRHIKALRSLFKEAKRDNLITENPVEFIEPLRSRANVSRRPFTIEELKSILAVADDEWRSLIRFGLYTGQRIGDIATLTWNNIDLIRGEIRLVTKKTGKQLCIPIAKPLIEHIEGLAVSDNPDQPIHAKSHELMMRHGRVNVISNAFADLLFKAGLRDSKVSHRKRSEKELDTPRKVHALSFHCLRYTAVTLLHEAGVPHAVVQQLIGHDSKSAHDGYIGVGREALVDAATKFPDLA